MIVIEGVEMPRNCHECDSSGISDLVGLNCPHEFDDRYEGNVYAKKPKDCPLKEK